MSRRGHDRERQVKAVLEEEGWFVTRAAGSLGDADLVASRPLGRNGAEVWIIEVKSTHRGPYHSFGPADREAIRKAAKVAGGIAKLAFWPPRGKLQMIDESEWPV